MALTIEKAKIVDMLTEMGVPRVENWSTTKLQERLQGVIERAPEEIVLTKEENSLLLDEVISELEKENGVVKVFDPNEVKPEPKKEKEIPMAKVKKKVRKPKKEDEAEVEDDEVEEEEEEKPVRKKKKKKKAKPVEDEEEEESDEEEEADEEEEKPTKKKLTAKQKRIAAAKAKKEAAAKKKTKTKPAKKAKKTSGPTAKEEIFKAWLKSPKSSNVEKWSKAHKSVQLSTIRSWVSGWKNGKGLPRCAADMKAEVKAAMARAKKLAKAAKAKDE